MTTEDLEPLPDDLRRLLDAERAAPPPPPEVQARVWSAVAAAGAAGPANPDGRPRFTPSSATVAAVSAVSAVVGMAVGALLHALWVEPEVRVVTVERVVHAPAPTTGNPPAPPPAPEPGALAAPAQPVPVRAATAPSRPLPVRALMAPARPDPFALETALVERARTALARGQAGLALAAVHEHRARFAAGLLAEERDAIEVQALLSDGKAEQAAQAAGAFLSTYPDSVHQARVNSVLQAAQR